MSLLQIKSLRAPLDLRREPLNTAGTQTSTVTGNATYQPTDEGVFTCYFNRTVTATDFPQPVNLGDTPGFDIKILVYDECYIFIYETTLNATQANIRDNNHICFKLMMSDTDFQRLGGCNIYVHVVINNPNATADNRVQFRATFSENYHETIKHIHIYDEKSMEMVYWSTRQALPATGEAEPVRESIALNEDAFIHVRTTGLWGKDVIVSIYERGLGYTALARIIAPMGQNRKAITVSMKYLLACYCNKTHTTYNEGDAINLRFYIRTDCILLERMQPIPIVPLSPISLPGGSVNNSPNNNQRPDNPFLQESGDLHLLVTMGDQTLPAVNNGAVFVQVNTGEAGIVEPDRYRDFRIGYMCHIEGIGKLANKTDNTSDTNPGVTVYPLHTYEIMLKDLVSCGLVTLEEAIYLTTVGHDMQTLETRANLEANFNKTSAPLASGKSLISVFLDNTYRENGVNRTYANSKAIRKLLVQIQHKTEVFTDEALRYICRDAWQGSSARATTRYDSSQECPFGEFFLNYIGVNFKLFVGRQHDNYDIQRYDAQDNIRPISPNQNDKRDAIAFHQGTSGYSIGCLTFNIAWNKQEGNTPAQNKVLNNHKVFNNTLYPDTNKDREYRKLNFLCIDERHAITTQTDRRYHDLINRNGVIQT